MAAPYSFNPFNRYYFDTETFIAIIHELEELPEMPLQLYASQIDSLAPADIDRWMSVFGVTADEAKYIICAFRYGGHPRVQIPDEILEKWP
jgi:hypothetical protein